jgi:hypothetical protein
MIKSLNRGDEKKRMSKISKRKMKKESSKSRLEKIKKKNTIKIINGEDENQISHQNQE